MRIKKAFTLAEVMIVLVIIGVLSAILLPVAFQAAPDENVAKFKKLNNTFGTVITELVTSDKYFENGDLGRLSGGGGETPNGSHLCHSLADILTTKSENCSTTNPTYSSSGSAQFPANLSTLPNWFDAECQTKNISGASIITLNNNAIIYFWDNFGAMQGGRRVFMNPTTKDGLHTDANGFDTAYALFCIDIDERNQGEAPFGYGVRADGRIMYGTRAQQWIEKEIQRKD